MTKKWEFDDTAAFLAKLRELLDSGVPANHLDTVTPYPLHEAEHLLPSKPSKIRFFTLIGALSGLMTGFGFTIYTVLEWPLITGGKPLVSIPAFLVIAFELTILFGSIVTFAGFLILARFPSVRSIRAAHEYSNQFIIIQYDERIR